MEICDSIIALIARNIGTTDRRLAGIRGSVEVNQIDRVVLAHLWQNMNNILADDFRLLHPSGDAWHMVLRLLV